MNPKCHSRFLIGYRPAGNQSGNRSPFLVSFHDLMVQDRMNIHHRRHPRSQSTIGSDGVGASSDQSETGSRFSHRVSFPIRSLFFFAELRLGVMMDSTIAHHNESAQNRHDPSNNATIKKRTSLVDRWSPLSAEPVSIVANYFSPIKSRKETQQARNVAIEMAFGLKRNLWEIPWHWHSKATPPTPPTPSVDAAESPRIESGNRVRR